LNYLMFFIKIEHDMLDTFATWLHCGCLNLLDPRLLRAFVAIVDAGGFTAAADRLHITQSTISQQLARLEESVGQQLVERGARPVHATASGERLLGYARRILMLESEARAVLGDPAGANSVRIGLPEDIVSPQMTA